AGGPASSPGGARGRGPAGGPPGGRPGRAGTGLLRHRGGGRRGAGRFLQGAGGHGPPLPGRPAGAAVTAALPVLIPTCVGIGYSYQISSLFLVPGGWTGPFTEGWR